MIEQLVSALSAARDFVLGGTVTPGYITYKDLSVKKEKNNNNANKKKKKGKKSGTDTAQTAGTNTNTNNNNNTNDSTVSDVSQPSEGEKVTGVTDSTPSETATAPSETLDL